MKIVKVLGVCGLVVAFGLGCATGGGASDEELITNVITAWKTAIEAEDVEAAMACYADSYTDPEGRGKEETGAFLSEAKDQGYMNGIEVDLQDLVIEIDGDAAVAEPVSLYGSFGGMDLSYGLTKVDGTWLVTSGDQY